MSTNLEDQLAALDRHVAKLEDALLCPALLPLRPWLPPRQRKTTITTVATLAERSEAAARQTPKHGRQAPPAAP